MEILVKAVIWIRIGIILVAGGSLIGLATYVNYESNYTMPTYKAEIVEGGEKIKAGGQTLRVNKALADLIVEGQCYQLKVMPDNYVRSAKVVDCQTLNK